MCIASDRLLSLGDFGYLGDRFKTRNPIEHRRNLMTMVLYACGTLHEAFIAVDALQRLGLIGLLDARGRATWKAMRAVRDRWRKEPFYRLLRNKMAFHIDEPWVRRGMERYGEERRRHRLVWKQGNTKKERRSQFVFATDCMWGNLFPKRSSRKNDHKRLSAVLTHLRHAHLNFGGIVHDLFIEALRGAGAGRKLSPPLHRHTGSGMTPERLLEIEALFFPMGAGRVRDAALELLDEFKRLRQHPSQPVKQSKPTRDPRAKLCRDIAATAREYLRSGNTGAATRLQSLLDQAKRVSSVRGRRERAMLQN